MYLNEYKNFHNVHIFIWPQMNQVILKLTHTWNMCKIWIYVQNIVYKGWDELKTDFQSVKYSRTAGNELRIFFFLGFFFVLLCWILGKGFWTRFSRMLGVIIFISLIDFFEVGVGRICGFLWKTASKWSFRVIELLGFQIVLVH